VITGRFWTGIFWITRIVSPWRDLPAEFGRLELRRWTEAELWDVMLALPESDISDTPQIMDSTIVRAH
jgi:transposase